MTGKENIHPNRVTKRKSLESKKEELLTKCITVLREPEEKREQNINPFAMFVLEKLEKLDQRSKLIAEKRITDILFEMEMNMYVNTKITV